jgi:hypothetical protein
MTTLTTDRFIEAFAAQLIEKGYLVLRLNDPKVRERLLGVYEFLDEEIDAAHKDADQDWEQSLINIRNLFQPSPIGSFDKFEAMMRSRQVYLTEHPNPYYQDIVFRLPAAAAASIIQSLDKPLRDLVGRTVDRYFEREKVNA